MFICDNEGVTLDVVEPENADQAPSIHETPPQPKAYAKATVCNDVIDSQREHKAGAIRPSSFEQAWYSIPNTTF